MSLTPVQQFVQEACILDKDESTNLGSFVRAYVSYCHAKGLYVGNPMKMAKNLKTIPQITLKKGGPNNQMVADGVVLKLRH